MEPVALSRAEWWEILFFIKKQEPKQQQEVNGILLQSLDDQVTYQEACWETQAPICFQTPKIDFNLVEIPTSLLLRYFSG